MNCIEFNSFSQDKTCYIRVTIILEQRGLAVIIQFMVRTVPRTPHQYSYVTLRLCCHMYSTSLLHFFTGEDSFNLSRDVNYKSAFPSSIKHQATQEDGGVEIQLHMFLNSAPYEIQWSASRPSASSRREEPRYTRFRGWRVLGNTISCLCWKTNHDSSGITT